MKNAEKWILIIGYGSQAQAWAANLRESGFKVFIALRDPKQSLAAADGFETLSLEELAIYPLFLNTKRPLPVALLIPDDEITGVYERFLAKLQNRLLILVAHGLSAIPSDRALLSKLNPWHAVSMIAPKAIGPKLREAYLHERKVVAAGARPRFVTSRADGITLGDQAEVESLYFEVLNGIGIQTKNWVETEFEVEAIGDMLSEQGLLVGGLYALIVNTVEEMRAAGIPETLIKEECFTELDLIVSLISQIGPTETLEKISKAAALGGAQMAKALERGGLKDILKSQFARVRNHEFSREALEVNRNAQLQKMISDWKAEVSDVLHGGLNAGRYGGKKPSEAASSLSSTPTPPPFRKSVERITPPLLRGFKGKAPIKMLTAYDYPTARVLDRVGIEVLLVGDSLGVVVYGHEDTTQVTMEDMIRHTQAVRRGASRALVLADLPFMSYQASTVDAIRNAGRLIKEGRAHAVKLEGGLEVIDSVRGMTQAGIPVCGHIGLMPQSIHAIGSYRKFGKNHSERENLLTSARALEEAGAFMIVLECVDAKLSAEITSILTIPTIGIGSGKGRVCDGQVLVTHDLVGFTDGHVPKFVKQEAQVSQVMQQAASAYVHRLDHEYFRDPIETPPGLTLEGLAKPSRDASVKEQLS